MFTSEFGSLSLTAFSTTPTSFSTSLPSLGKSDMVLLVGARPSPSCEGGGRELTSLSTFDAAEETFSGRIIVDGSRRFPPHSMSVLSFFLTPATFFLLFFLSSLDKATTPVSSCARSLSAASCSTLDDSPSLWSFSLRRISSKLSLTDLTLGPSAEADFDSLLGWRDTSSKLLLLRGIPSKLPVLFRRAIVSLPLRGDGVPELPSPSISR
mmetsp:Transcript_19605/g.40956  ORF Transcript_19605/g.40956 Transcript_19605/m.40956 type:complete len:210 (-) Transcript_19605:2279-2908(-)